MTLYICMRRTRWLALVYLLTVFLLLSGDEALANTVGSYTRSGYGGQALIEPLEMNYFGIGSYRLFKEIPLVPNIGNTIWIRSNSQDPYYSRAIDLLTNGIDDQMNFICGRSGWPISEKRAFFPNGSGPDFNGCILTGLGIQINAASYTIPGLDMNHDGIWMDFSYTVTLLVDGYVVPEPTPFVCLSVLCIPNVVTLLRRRMVENPLTK